MLREVATAKMKALPDVFDSFFEILVNCFKYLPLRVAARSFLTVLRPPVNVTLLSPSALITQKSFFFFF